MQIEMPIVADCDAMECVYNNEQQCTAHAITVGGGSHPACDTYVAKHKELRRKTLARDHAAGVGACKVHGCRYNRHLACEAREIHVNAHGAHADCATYEATRSTP